MERIRERPPHWSPGRRYYDFKTFLGATFGARVAKLPIDAGFTCPNRDGTRGTGGCSYCDGRGSRLRQAGPLPSVTEQLAAGAERYRRHGAGKFIPYFQTFTNTHAPPDRLRALYDEAAAFPDAVGLAVGTRPDCVPDPVLDLLAGYAPRLAVFVEFGLQTAHPATLARIGRGHTWEESVDAVRRAAGRGLLVVAHLILGLPGESPAMMRETARAIAALPVASVKIHLLLALAGTRLGDAWRRGEVPLPALPEYAGWVADVLELLPAEVSLQRLTADGYRDVLLAPGWAGNKLAVLNAIERELARRDSWQGKHAGSLPAAGASF
jgi:radical SAM protein (TIGR01212 family)